MPQAAERISKPKNSRSHIDTPPPCFYPSSSGLSTQVYHSSYCKQTHLTDAQVARQMAAGVVQNCTESHKRSDVYAVVKLVKGNRGTSFSYHTVRWCQPACHHLGHSWPAHSAEPHKLLLVLVLRSKYMISVMMHVFQHQLITRLCHSYLAHVYNS